MGGHHLRHRQPVLHVSRPWCGRRRPACRLFGRALQQRRRPHQRGAVRRCRASRADGRRDHFPAGMANHLNRLVDARVPVVAIDRQQSGAHVDTVLADNEQGAYLATTHLIESGYQRIACVSGPPGVFTATRRLRGYRRALEEHGRPYEEELVRHGDFREEGGYRAMASLLGPRPRPDALFAANNLMTVGAVECLVDSRIAVPDEMGVVGFDDVPWAHLVRPSLTTVAQPTYELGCEAAGLLTKRIADPERPPTTVTLETKLQIRDSSLRTRQA
ncbi:substrate-binding domain-containing protein [Phytohabitans flavus]|uniref:substrate-binding domain-containing protein n=1 Tax=Phytohabitans flavus TaxID=1076124 RepID=UPI00363CAC77